MRVTYSHCFKSISLSRTQIHERKLFEQRPNLQVSNMSMNVFYPGKPGEAAALDIVFVHGLRGDSIRTWSHAQVCWPRDLLKIDLDNVRIMSWAYDAQIANLKGSASQASVFGNAETLLSDLSNERLESAEVCTASGVLVRRLTRI